MHARGVDEGIEATDGGDEVRYDLVHRIMVSHVGEIMMNVGPSGAEAVRGLLEPRLVTAEQRDSIAPIG